jgi:protein O-mannosyl-transferase
MLRNIVICVLLILVTLVVYMPLRKAEFINFDDPGYVGENRHVQGGLFPEPRNPEDSRFDNIVWAFAVKDADGWHLNRSEFNWHPMTWLSYMADMDFYQWYQKVWPDQKLVRPSLAPDLPSSGGYHLTNVLLHTIDVVLLFLVLCRLTKIPWASAVVAFLFALHPQHTESVAWIAERKDVLSGLFWILTLGAYAFYVERRDSMRWVYYGLMLFFAVLGLMAKPMLVTLPFMLLLLDVWPLKRITFGKPAELLEVDDSPQVQRQRKGKTSKAPMLPLPEEPAPESPFGLPTWAWALIEKAPFIPLIAASSIITFFVQHEGGAMTYATRCPLDVRLMNIPISYVTYLFKSFVPVNLAVFYPYNHDPHVLQTGGALLLLATITGLVIWQIRRRPYLAVGWFWFLGTLVPVIGVVQVGAQAMADRYTYIPTLGLFLAAVFGLREAVVQYRREQISSVPVALAALLVASLTAALLVTGVKWFDPDNKENIRWAITNSSLIVALASPALVIFALVVLSIVVGILWYFDRLWALVALAVGAVLILVPLAGIQVAYWPNTKILFEHALEVEPHNAVAHCNLGESAFLQGRFEEAEIHFKAALKIDDEQTGAHNNLGWALARKGPQYLDEAIGHYIRSLEIDNKNAAAHNNYALALIQKKRIPEAIEHLNLALQLEKDYGAAHNNLGMIMADMGKLAEAELHYREAVRINPKDLVARSNLAMVLSSQDKTPQALEQLQEVLRLDSRYPVAHTNIGLIFCRIGKYKEAVDEFNEALSLDPNQPGAHNNLGMALTHLNQPDEAIAHFREALRLDPGQSDARLNLSTILRLKGDTEGAIRVLREGLSVRPDWPQAMGVLAWILSSDPRLHDGDEAVKWATRACELTQYKDPQFVDTLAAAYAAKGMFKEAIETSQKALKMAEESRPEIAPAVKLRLSLYESGKPVWQMP